MAEISEVEMRTVRSGAAAGGVTELAKNKLSGWFDAAKETVVKRIGLTKAEAQIQGNKEANPKIGELGVKVINGVGELVERRSGHLEKSAYSRSNRATEHEQKLADLRQKPVEAIKTAELYSIANVTLAMHELPGYVGPRPLTRIEQLKRLAENISDRAGEKWHRFWVEKDNKVAERDLTTAIKYSDGAKAVKEFADTFESILNDTERTKNLNEAENAAASEWAKVAQIKDKLAQEYQGVMTKGADIGKAAIPEVGQVPTNQPKEQIRVMTEHQQSVAQTGTK